MSKPGHFAPAPTSPYGPSATPRKVDVRPEIRRPWSPNQIDRTFNSAYIAARIFQKTSTPACDSPSIRREIIDILMKPSGIDKSTLDEIIRRVVEVARPEKIILFGSAARGEMNRHSDVDLLIIKDGADAIELMGEIYMNLDGVGAAVDSVVVTPTDVEHYKDSHSVIIKPALQEGRVVYESS